MAVINPYLSFDGTCEKAFNFYKTIFGGDFSQVSRYSDMPSEKPLPADEQNKILHIALPISEETMLMGADMSAAFGGTHQAGNNISLSINTKTEEDAKRMFKALSEGGKVTMELQKTFWNALFGTVTDQFGIHWQVNYDYGQTDRPA